LDKNKITA